ncbi:MAG: FadR family transcriptional regulator [Shimia sp.]
MSEDANIQRAADQIVESLTQAIHTGTLEVGQAPPSERQLMQDFGASRTVVREAIGRLAAQGLLHVRPRHRPVVRAPDFDAAAEALQSIVTHLLKAPNGTKQLFDTRVFVEAGIVRLAAQKATKADILNIKTALEANRAATEDYDLFYETDIAFHGALFAVSANPALIAFHKAYTSWIAPQWQQMRHLPARNILNVTSHEAIFDAILMRDPDAAEAALTSHLADAWDQVHATFGDT